MPRRSSYLISVAAAAVVAVAGCGSGSGGSEPTTAKEQLSAAVSSLSDSDVLTTTLKLDTTPETLQSFAAEDDDNLSDADAQAIASAQVVIEAKTADGQDLADVEPGDNNAANVAFQLLVNGRPYAEIRVVGGDLYIKGDLKGILDLVHESKAYAEVEAKVASMPDFVQAAVAGKWVSLSGAAAQGLAGSFGGGQSPDQAQSRQLLDKLKDILSRDVVVRSAGSDDRGDHLVLTGHTRALARDVVGAVSSAVPGGGAALGRLDPSDIDDRVITVDAWVKDGTLSELSLDIAQFAKPGEIKAGDHLPIVLTFEQEGDDIATPSGAVPVDLTQLGSLMGALGT